MTTATEACVCVGYMCMDFNYDNATSVNNTVIEQAKQLAAEIRKNLTVDEKSLSSFRRKLTCASDPRQSSTNIGVVWTTILIVLVVVMVMLDLQTFARQVPKCVKSCRKRNTIYVKKNNIKLTT